MPVVRMEGHNYTFPISDVLRLFYGACSPGEESEITAGSDLHIVIHSRLSDGKVATWMDGTDAIQYPPELNFEIPPKREVKRQLYWVLSRFLDREFPWGSLTGIRPTIVAREARTAEELMERYFLRGDKAALAMETATFEDRILCRLPVGDVSVYVGIPFCRSRCSYCSFISQDASSKMHLLGAYSEAMVREIEEYRREDRTRISCLYIGGGTPTVFDDGLFHECMENIFRELHADEIPEITVEAGRADTITENKLRTLKDLGVSRICINPQTLSDKTLTAIGRKHTVEEFYRAYHLASHIGFTTINTDLIAGLPEETEEDFAHTLEGILSLCPENITMHTLSKKKKASLAQEMHPLISSSEMTALDNMLSYGHQRLKETGYEPYYLYRQKDTQGGHENTGYTKPGHECLYNVAMMSDQRSILGFGAGSVSKSFFSGSPLERCPNIRDPEEYILRAEEMAVRKKLFFRV